MKRLIITAVGLALVGGIIIGGVVGNLWAPIAHAQTATPTVTATPGTPTATPTPRPVLGSGCYTNWNSASCATGWTAVSVGEWTAVFAMNTNTGGGPAAMVCAAPKAENSSFGLVYFLSDTEHNNQETNQVHLVNHDPCAICCGAAAAGSPSVIGGIAEPPDLAAATGTGASGMGSGTYAVLVGGLAFAVMGILAVKRRGVQR